MSVQFTILNGEDTGRVLSLTDGELTLGRSRSCDLQLNDRSVSRQHCQLHVVGGCVTIVDSDSAGGTTVNGSRIAQQALNSGDEVRVGNTLLRFDPVGTEQKTVLPDDSAGESQLADLVGTSIHDYQVQSVLAEGRSGVVFKAHDTNKGRDVALKVLWPEVSASKEDMQRFVRAMKTMFDIRHENIVRIYNAGKTGPHTWVAMEYVDGENMAAVIQRIGTAGMLDWEYAFRVAVHTARGLEAAFDHQIIHRNIAPNNIFMRSDDQVVKLGDMMLAKAMEGNHAQQITQPGQLIGELAWMSPERTSDSEAADGRSDIYSLGATCYALLTGRPPFEAPSFPELLQKIRTEVPQSPRTFQLSIHDMFEGCVLRMLEKRPDDRYQSPTALLRDLDRIATYANVPV